MTITMFIVGSLINFIVPFMYAYYGFRLNNALKKDNATIVEVHEKYYQPFRVMKYSIGALQLLSALFMLWAIARLYRSIKATFDHSGIFD